MMKRELEYLIGFELMEMELTENYRSSKKIIDYFDFYKTHPNTIIPSGNNKNYQSIITFNHNIHRTNLIDEIVRLIQYNIIDKGISPNEICIVRSEERRVGKEC